MEEQELLEESAIIEHLLLRFGWLEQRRFAQDLAGFGLTPPQFFILRSILSRDEHPTMSALAYDTLQNCATVTGIVDRLVKMGLATRLRDGRDRRQVLVELTPAGREVLNKVRGSREGRLRETLLRLSAQDARELLRLLRAYLEAFSLQPLRPLSGGERCDTAEDRGRKDFFTGTMCKKYADAEGTSPEGSVFKNDNVAECE